MRLVDNPEDFYLMVGAFAPNKRVDLAIAAFQLLYEELGDVAPVLVVIGGGQEEAGIKKNSLGR